MSGLQSLGGGSAWLARSCCGWADLVRGCGWVMDSAKNSAFQALYIELRCIALRCVSVALLGGENCLRDHVRRRRLGLVRGRFSLKLQICAFRKNANYRGLRALFSRGRGLHSRRFPPRRSPAQVSTPDHHLPSEIPGNNYGTPHQIATKPLPFISYELLFNYR